MRIIAIIFALALITTPCLTSASANIEYLRGVIISTQEDVNEQSINGDTIYRAQIQTQSGVIEAENELGILEPGDRVIVRTEQVPNYDDETAGSSETVYSIYERDRIIPLIALALVFAGAVISLGVRQGLRALSALAGTLFVIFGIYIPSLLAGFSPLTTSIIMGLLIAGCAVFITHGFKRSSAVAYGSTVLSVIVAVIIAMIAIHASGLTGATSDEVTFLAATSVRAFDFIGIMIGGVIIAMLGVLDDIAITQVAVVEELKRSKPNSTFTELYRAALRVGRDHAGALVNTLVLAYAGTSLPLLLLLQSQNLDTFVVINQEQFAFEIIRSLSGSIGLVACVPIATLLAIYLTRPCDHNHTTDGCPHCMTKLSSTNQS